MSTNLPSAVKIVTVWTDQQPVACLAYRRFPHRTARNLMIGSRMVVLPDFQGLGIGGMLADWIGQHMAENGQRFRFVIAHPVLLRHCVRSPRWRETTAGQSTIAIGPKADAGLAKWATKSRRLVLRSFEYQPSAA